MDRAQRGQRGDDRRSVERSARRRRRRPGAAPPNLCGIDGLHEPGDAGHGEGGGVFYHRPTSESVVAPVESRLGRRFDPRRLPPGMTQEIGHIADEQCRALLARWVETEEDLRSRTPANPRDGRNARCATRTGGPRAATPRRARIVFADGAMRKAPMTPPTSSSTGEARSGREGLTRGTRGPSGRAGNASQSGPARRRELSRVRSCRVHRVRTNPVKLAPWTGPGPHPHEA